MKKGLHAFTEVGLYTCSKCCQLMHVIARFPDDEPISRCWECPRRYFDGVSKKTNRAVIYIEDDGSDAIGRYGK